MSDFRNETMTSRKKVSCDDDDVNGGIFKNLCTYAAVEVKCSDKTLNAMKFTMLLSSVSHGATIHCQLQPAEVNSILCARSNRS